MAEDAADTTIQSNIFPAKPCKTVELKIQGYHLVDMNSHLGYYDGYWAALRR
ncbi:MAG: hypothetical protein Q4A74_07665 [Cardiobacteriaceae bacterium]|nr:hypothetical protein [Cardiobacteriaceae bacterium]